MSPCGAALCSSARTHRVEKHVLEERLAAAGKVGPVVGDSSVHVAVVWEGRIKLNLHKLSVVSRQRVPHKQVVRAERLNDSDCASDALQRCRRGVVSRRCMLQVLTPASHARDATITERFGRTSRTSTSGLPVSSDPMTQDPSQRYVPTGSQHGGAALTPAALAARTTTANNTVTFISVGLRIGWKQRHQQQQSTRASPQKKHKTW